MGLMVFLGQESMGKYIFLFHYFFGILSRLLVAWMQTGNNAANVPRLDITIFCDAQGMVWPHDVLVGL